MRAIGLILVLAIVAAAALGYSRGWFSVSSNGGESRSEVSVTIDKDQWRKDRDAFYDKTDQMARDLDKRLAELKEKAKDASGEAKERWNKAIADLSKKREGVNEEMREMKSATQESWASTKDRFRDSMRDLREWLDKQVGDEKR